MNTPEGRPRPTWRPLRRNRWLIARRIVQFSILAAFAGAPWFGAPLVQGTLAGSTWIGTLTLVDPLVAVQSLLAGHVVATAGLVGAGIIAAFYALLAGRLYCGWVCPINLVTDAAEGARRLLGIGSLALLRADRRLRHGVLVLALVASVATGVVAWEVVNPITFTVRALAFGLWTGGAVAVAAVFVFDLVVLRHGWCGHVCPVGAFYGWLGRVPRLGRLNVHALRADACTRCGDCFAVCPEPHVIVPVLKAGAATITIRDADCLRCGRCIDHCDEDVFALRLGAVTWAPAPAAAARSPPPPCG
jgi:ferredoxin-type protein NapH